MRQDPGRHRPVAESLRERKKALTRQLISDTATAMFLERGFDDVKVTEIADACGVAEKTVYNYFPTKESLVLDREQHIVDAIHRAFGPDGDASTPIDAALAVLAWQLDDPVAGFGRRSQTFDLADFSRFSELVDTTPALRAAQGDMMIRLTRELAVTLAERIGVSPDEPEPQIAAHAILGLWQVQGRSMRRHVAESASLREVRDKVEDDVRRAARLLESGLWSFGTMVKAGTNKEQLRAAADAAQQAGRQVAAAIRQAKAVRRQLMAEMERHGRATERDQRGRGRGMPPRHPGLR